MADEVVDLSEIVDRWRREDEEFDSVLGELTETAGQDADWVPLAEAEAAAGVSRSTLRAWFRTGQLRSRLMPGPHGMQRLVPLTDVMARAAKSPQRPARADSEEEAPVTTTAGSDVVRLAELAVSEARARAERAEARAEAAEAALTSAIERAAAAEAELRLRLGGQPS